MALQGIAVSLYVSAVGALRSAITCHLCLPQRICRARGRKYGGGGGDSHSYI